VTTSADRPDPVAAAKDEIRELVLLYSRGINRKDYDLLQSLYTADATDDHGRSYFATVPAFIARLREVLPAQRCSGLFVCNHLISVEGDSGEGEVYALSYHSLPDGAGGWAEHKMRVRYIDKYRKEGGRWHFSSRKLVIDHYVRQPTTAPEEEPQIPENDPSYQLLSSRIFHPGSRT
jgi:hypothetical protein